MKHRSNYTRHRKPIHGFTLIELLVVIAVIGLLMAVLTPALKKAKMGAKKILCKANLHQWGIAVNSYAESENERLPRQDMGPSGMNAWDVSNKFLSYDLRGTFGFWEDGINDPQPCAMYDYGIDQEEFIWCPLLPEKEYNLAKTWCTRVGPNTYNLWLGYSWWVPRGADQNNDGVKEPAELFPWDYNISPKRISWPQKTFSKSISNYPIVTDVVLRLPPLADTFGLSDNPDATTDLAAASVNGIGNDVFGCHQLNGLLRDADLLYADGRVDNVVNQGDNIRVRFTPSQAQYRNFY